MDNVLLLVYLINLCIMDNALIVIVHVLLVMELQHQIVNLVMDNKFYSIKHVEVIVLLDIIYMKHILANYVTPVAELVQDQMQINVYLAILEVH